MTEELKFWKWFGEHYKEYLYLDYLDKEKKEFILEVFLEQLHKYCSKLYFQIGGYPESNKKELVISAERNVEYFNAVEKLVSCAPTLENWEIVAFKQPKGVDFVTEYEGILLDPKKMWFIPLDNDKYPDRIGIRVYIDNYDEKYKQKYKQAVYQVLDTVLGEKVNGLEIHYVDIDTYSENVPEKNDLIELIELADYIAWRKGKSNT